MFTLSNTITPDEPHRAFCIVAAGAVVLYWRFPPTSYLLLLPARYLLVCHEGTGQLHSKPLAHMQGMPAVMEHDTPQFSSPKYPSPDSRMPLPFLEGGR